MIGEMLRTKATIYILPILGKDRTFFGWSKELLNVYMFEESYPGIDGHIYLLYKIGATAFDHSGLYKKLKNHEKYVGSYSVLINGGFTMAVFAIEEDAYQYDLKKFWSGKYSEFTDFFKMEILSFHGAVPNSLLHGILGKLDNTKKHLEKELTGKGSRVDIPKGMDLDSKPVVTTETFFFKDLKIFIDKNKKESCDSSPSDSKTEPESMLKPRHRRQG